MRIHSFGPIYNAQSRVLILGTMPSVESLRQAFYYAHPRNCFWPMISELLGEPLPPDPHLKAQMLLGHHIALWDVAHSCVREGSLDSAIKEPLPNDISSIWADCPDMGVVLFNGGAASKLFARLLPQLCGKYRQVLLPSTSPAYTIAYERKRAA